MRNQARVFMILMALQAGLATASGDAARVEIGETISLQSAVLGETRPVQISVPVGYDGVSRLPVLFVLDAEEHFGVFATTVDYLSRHTNIPPMMVVGVPNTGNRENNMVPFVSTMVCVLLSMVPFGLSSTVLAPPSFALIAVYLWTLMRPDLMPSWSVFLLGIFQDLLWGGPVGLRFVVSALRDGTDAVLSAPYQPERCRIRVGLRGQPATHFTEGGTQ